MLPTISSPSRSGLPASFVPAVAEFLDQRRHFFVFVVFVQALKATVSRQLEMSEQAAPAPGVFGENQIDFGENFARTRRKITNRTYRCRHDPQGPRGLAHAVSVLRPKYLPSVGEQSAPLTRRVDAGVVRLRQGDATPSAAWRAVKRW